MRSLVGVSFAALALMAAGCGGGGACKGGAVKDGEKCRPFDPDDDNAPEVSVDPPARTRAVGTVTLTTNEPATIYYTIDGTLPTTSSANEPNKVVLPDMPDDSVVTYFAVDEAGNASAVEVATWTIDRAGPRLSALELTLAGDQRTVSWTAPASDDLRSIVVARVEGRLAVMPEAERAYTVGEEIAPGITVVHAGPAAPGEAGTFTESLPVAVGGLVRYAAWSADDLGNYGPPAVDFVASPLSAQTGSLTIDPVAGSVTVSTQAPLFTLSGLATYDDANDMVTVQLALENRTNRVVFGPKVVLATVSNSADLDNADGSIGDADFRAFGAAIAPGALVIRTLRLTSVGSSTPFDVGFAIETARIFGGAMWDNGLSSAVVDEETYTDFELGMAPGTSGPNGNMSMKSGGITPDGFYILGTKNAGRVVAIDLTTGLPAFGATLAPQKSAVPRLLLDEAGSTVYALLQTGHPYSERENNTQEGGGKTLVRLDAATLMETGRLDLGLGKPSTDLRLSPDGRWLSIVNRLGQVQVVDTEAWAIASQFSSPGARASAWSLDGSQLAVVTDSRVRLHTADLGFPKTSEVSFPSGDRVMRAAFVADGRLWVGRESDLQIVDVTTGVSVPVDYDAEILEVYDGEAYISGNGSSSFYRMNSAGVEVSSWNFDSSNYGHHIARSPF